MDYLISFIIIGGLITLIVNYQQKNKHKSKNVKSITPTKTKSRQKINAQEVDRGLLTRISNLESRINRNESSIQFLKESDQRKELQIDQMHQWFGSMIRHSAEEPFKKEAIEKFLAEEELKSDTNGTK